MKVERLTLRGVSEGIGRRRWSRWRNGGKQEKAETAGNVKKYRSGEGVKVWLDRKGIMK